MVGHKLGEFSQYVIRSCVRNAFWAQGGPAGGEGFGRAVADDAIPSLQDTETIHLRQEVKKVFGYRERKRHGYISYQWPPVLVIARGAVFVAAASDALETSGGPAGPEQRLPPICPGIEKALRTSRARLQSRRAGPVVELSLYECNATAECYRNHILGIVVNCASTKSLLTEHEMPSLTRPFPRTPVHVPENAPKKSNMATAPI